MSTKTVKNPSYHFVLHTISGFYGTAANIISIGFCLCRQSIINLQMNMCKIISANHKLTIFCFHKKLRSEIMKYSIYKKVMQFKY